MSHQQYIRFPVAEGSDMKSVAWFKNLFGFEESPQSVKRWLKVEGSKLISQANGRSFDAGIFSRPTLAQLRFRLDEILENAERPATNCTVEHIAVEDALELHSLHPGSVFQAASQFNCLEFPTPTTAPETGVAAYALDMTQGPACALACAPGTIIRNYFVHMSDGTQGQSRDNQIDNLEDVAAELNNSLNDFWFNQNGYIFTTGNDNLIKLNAVLLNKTAAELDYLRSLIRVGIQSDVEVVFENRFQQVSHPALVTQVYASALSCAYSRVPNHLWEPFARLVLESAYESTLAVAAIRWLEQPDRSCNRDVYLTFLGAGVFGNEMPWIVDAIARAIVRVERMNIGLRVYLCHYRHIRQDIVDDICKRTSELHLKVDI